MYINLLNSKQLKSIRVYALLNVVTSDKLFTCFFLSTIS